MRRRLVGRPAVWRGALLWALLAGHVSAAAAPSYIIHWMTDARPAAVEVGGISEARLTAMARRDPADAAWAETFAVYAEQPGDAGRGTTGAAPSVMPPMAGVWRVADGRLRFEPRFPLSRGLRYRAEFRPEGAAAVVSYFELPPDTTAPTTTVTQIFPSARVVPENQLKFYVQFSAPMSRGGIYDHIQIRDAAGRVIELAFLELGEELWDPAMTRLTLLIDPGRIKRGVKPLEDVGPVFEAGRRYSLSVGTQCRDAAGRPLREAFERKFLVAPADRTPPDPARWSVRAPAAGAREALIVEFDEPMDQALALRLIGIEAVEGVAALGAEERRWTFVPDQPWQRGAHRLVVATTIEDLAGNNIGKAFDVDVFAGVQRRIKSETVNIDFEVK